MTATVVCPGLTKSQFHARASLKRPQNSRLMMPAEKVAKIGYRALMRGQPIVVTGWLNKLATSVAKMLPTRLMCKVTGAVNKNDRKD